LQVNSALKILSRSGYIEYNEENDNAARVMFLITKNELYRIDNASVSESKIIEALLRNYGGLFTDYVYIDESLLALQTGFSVQGVYLILKGLSQQRLLHFIPKSKTPLITYSQRREDAERIVIPKSVYEERKSQYEKRIKSMIEYASSDTICRSRLLLRYFGEKNNHDCGQCDVCIENKKKSKTEKSKEKSEREEIKDAVMQLLRDGDGHAVTELQSLHFSESAIDTELHDLITEELVIIQDGLLMIKNASLVGHVEDSQRLE
jgi:ATP-dependent DNA helicase RecQ